MKHLKEQYWGYYNRHNLTDLIVQKFNFPINHNCNNWIVFPLIAQTTRRFASSFQDGRSDRGRLCTHLTWMKAHKRKNKTNLLTSYSLWHFCLQDVDLYFLWFNQERKIKRYIVIVSAEKYFLCNNCLLQIVNSTHLTLLTLFKWQIWDCFKLLWCWRF